MKAIFIDADAREVLEVTLSDNFEASFDEIRSLIKCRRLTVAGILDNDDTVYVDDEGLSQQEHYFRLRHPDTGLFAGNGMIVGTNTVGDPVAATSDLDRITRHLEFLDKYDVMVHALTPSAAA